MDKYKIKDLSERLDKESNQKHKNKMLYMWIKQNHISLNEYNELVKNHGVSHNVSDHRKLLINFIKWWKENRSQYENLEYEDVDDFINQ